MGRPGRSVLTPARASLLRSDHRVSVELYRLAGMGTFLVKRVVRSRLFIAIYVVVGLIVANSHHYFAHLGHAKRIVSAVLGVALWPLVLFGINLHI